MQLVSDSYIQGIKEGRSFLQNNPDLTREEMQSCAAQCARLMRDHVQPLRDMFKGERDFWRNQLKKES